MYQWMQSREFVPDEKQMQQEDLERKMQLYIIIRANNGKIAIVLFAQNKEEKFTLDILRKTLIDVVKHKGKTMPLEHVYIITRSEQRSQAISKLRDNYQHLEIINYLQKKFLTNPLTENPSGIIYERILKTQRPPIDRYHKKEDLSIIRHWDPVVIWMGAEKNDVIMIKNPNTYSGIEVTYRRVY
jgi:hypothetical protein